MVYRNGSPLITTLQVQSVNLTWDAYQALPSTKLTDGVYYNITDLTQSTLDIVNTLSGENTLLKARVAELESKNVYSTDEKVVGTWIDGKPIYRKVYDFRQTAYGSSFSVADLHIDFVVDIKGSASPSKTPTSTSYTHMLPYYDGSTRSMFYLSNSNTMVQTLDGNKYGCVILEYTKTTD